MRVGREALIDPNVELVLSLNDREALELIRRLAGGIEDRQRGNNDVQIACYVEHNACRHAVRIHVVK